MEEKVRTLLEKYDLLPRGAKVVVAVSGGPDSVALLHLLTTWREEWNWTLHVAHLNHLLRGKAAEADAQYVAELAQRLGVPVSVGREDVRQYQREHGLSTEEAARQVRLAFLRRVAGEVGAERIALGHTADDRVETLLLNLLRGTGIEGLGSIRPRTGLLVRPLLECWREETEAYCRAQGLQPRVDASNLELLYRRNRLRLELLPYLEREFEARVRANLLRLCHLAALTDEYLRTAGREALAAVVNEQGPNYVRINVEPFQKLPEALQLQVLREAVRQVKGNLTGVAFRHLEAVRREAYHLEGSREVSLPGRLWAVREYGELTLALGRPPAPPQGEWPLAVPGTTEVPELGVVVEAQVVPVVGDWRPYVPSSPWEVCLDLEKCGKNLLVRTWRTGDRFRPLGLSGTKSLQDFFTDRKVPRSRRPWVPLVATPERVVWVVGYTVEDAFRLTERTRAGLHLVVHHSCQGGEIVI